MSWGAGRTQGSPGPRAHQRARYVLRRARPLKPATVLFEGDDPRAYIIASNLPVTPSWYGDSVGHYEGDTLVVGIKIGRGLGTRRAGPAIDRAQYGRPGCS